MNLKDWLYEAGPEQVAKRLKVKPKRVLAWYYGERSPSRQMGRQLIKLSDGKVTVDDIRAHKAAIEHRHNAK